MNKIGGSAEKPGERSLDPVSVVVDASPLLLRSAGVKNYVYYWARSLAEHAGPNRLSLFPFLNGLGRDFAHQTSVLGPAAHGAAARLAVRRQRQPLPILNWLTPASDIFHASHHGVASAAQERG